MKKSSRLHWGRCGQWSLKGIRLSCLNVCVKEGGYRIWRPVQGGRCPFEIEGHFMSTHSKK